MSLLRRYRRLVKVYRDWEPSDKYCAQNAHLLLAVSTIEAAAIHGFNLVVVAIVFLIVMAIKEFWFDIYGFERDSMIGSCCDWIFYLLGILTGWLSIYDLWTAVALIALPITATTWIDIKYPDYTNKPYRLRWNR